MNKSKFDKRDKCSTRLANACINALRWILKVAKHLNPVYYIEREAPHYAILRKTIAESEEAENYSLNVVEKELLFYKAYSKVDPSKYEEYLATHKLVEDEFASIQHEREEVFNYPVLGLRLIAKEMIHFIETPEAEIFITVNELLQEGGEEILKQLFYNMTIQINYPSEKK